MTLATMMYGLIVAVLVGGATWFLDRGLRAAGRPTRWVWIGALGVGGLAPFLPRFLPAATPGGGPGSFALPVHALYQLGTPGAASPEQSGSLLAGIGPEDALGALWILGSVLVLIFFALLCLRLRRLRATWEPREVCGEEVLRSERFGPAVVGLIRSWIVLPSWSFGLGERELEMVVLHEQEHVRARDPALLAVGLLLASLSPWNPAVWWSLARLRLAVEGDCDRRVLARGTPARSYARLLLTVAAGCRRTPDPVPALIRGGPSVIERRLKMISTATRKPRIRVSILTAAAALGLFALACDTPIPQSPGELEPRTRSQAVVVPEAEVGPDVGVGLEAEFGYVDEDGTFQGLKLDPKVEAQVRATLERAKRVRETLGERLQAGEIKKGMIPGDETVLRDLWLRLGTVTDHLEELSGPELKEKTTTELAMEVRRLHAAFEAGEVTPEEAQRMFRTHMEARRVRLRLPDRPH
ncbi:M56 family metallopeptidase [Candidatus Palauibacter sp.]|uniref:M56 family metallopeptidase n=1 Tax=Candidatus Palauibacter sp. TaxID=3101350 RepID=UPI003B5187C5